MGNGVSSATVHIDGETLSTVEVKKLILRSQNDAKHALDMAECTGAELALTRATLLKKDEELIALREKIGKLRSVLQRTIMAEGKPDILATIQEEMLSPSPEGVRKKQGVSGESCPSGEPHQLTYYEKDFRSKQLIKDAIMRNDFLKNLDATQVREMVNCMYERKLSADDFIIREGDAGQHLFVSAEGMLQVLKDGKVVGKLSGGRAFGELAILYNCTRTASVKALEQCKVWALDRQAFQAIMMKTGLERQKEKIQFLRSVELLHDLPNDKLSKIADVLEVDFFEDGEYITREGQNGDTFYVISKGEVKVTQKVQGKKEPQQVRLLGRGDFFGEKALLHEDKRTANVIATPPGVECLTLNRDSFIRLIGDLSELQERDYGDENRRAERLYQPISKEQVPLAVSQVEQETFLRSDLLVLKQRHTQHEQLSFISLHDLEIVSTLGIGGFGRVELVRLTTDNTKAFALKCLKKQHVVDTKQQEHVYSEKCILKSCASPFIVRLFKTFKDSKYVYLLMEVCLGGELWTILRDRGNFDDITARFCIACVTAALQYLHGRGIVFRDLKPENLLLAQNGYIKLVDFGFAKQIGLSRKTWTFCGTPEYVAPEIILNKGHDLSVDFWALGILTYELCSGVPPFAASEPMKTYNLIIRGIDALTFSKKISRNGQSFIKKLCTENPSERLGCQKSGYSDIKKHKWFQGFDWDGLYSQEMIPPLYPKIENPVDCSNFDHYDTEDGIPPDEFSGWDEDF